MREEERVWHTAEEGTVICVKMTDLDTRICIQRVNCCPSLSGKCATSINVKTLTCGSTA